MITLKVLLFLLCKKLGSIELKYSVTFPRSIFEASTNFVMDDSSADVAFFTNYSDQMGQTINVLHDRFCGQTLSFVSDKMIKKLSFIILLIPFALASERSSDLGCSGRVHHNVTLSAYYPDFSSDFETDYLDAKMKKLRTLQDFLDGRAEFVTASMDLDSGIPYGTKLCIPELNEKFLRQIPLQVRDRSHYDDVNMNSPDFSHVDICVRTEEDTYDNSVNGLVTLYV